MIIEKNDPRKLTTGLSHDEFKCQCDDCHATIIDPELVKAYKKLRESAGIPLRINSGYRCQQHNRSKKVKGVAASQHCTGSAIDIDLGNLLRKYHDLERLITIVKLCGFTYNKVYENFIHLDVRRKK